LPASQDKRRRWDLGDRDAAAPLEFQEAQRTVVQIARQDHANGVLTKAFCHAPEQRIDGRSCAIFLWATHKA
jgi:hypothetical protein